MVLKKSHKSEDDNRIWVLKTDSIFYNAITVALRNFQIYGMYPINNLPKWVFYCHAAFVHFAVTTPLPVLAYIYVFVNRKGMGLERFIDLMFVVMELAITVLKYAPIRLYPDKVRHTMEWLDLKEFKTFHPDQEKTARRTCEMTRTVYHTFLAMCVVALFFLIFKPLLMGTKALQVDLWLPFDPEKNNYIFWTTYTVIGLSITNYGFGNCSLDCLITLLILHATGQVKIIKESLRDVIKHAEERVLNEQESLSPTEFKALKNEYVYEDICKCVDRYNLVKEFSKDIEDTYSFSLFVQFATSIIVLGFACIQFSLVKPWSLKFFYIVIWIITMSWEVLLFSYFGSLLYFETLTLAKDIYLTDWLELDPRSQKAYLIILENAKKPIMIRAGKIIDLSLETFATIMRRSYSLLALCRRLL